MNQNNKVILITYLSNTLFLINSINQNLLGSNISSKRLNILLNSLENIIGLKYINIIIRQNLLIPFDLSIKALIIKIKRVQNNWTKNEPFFKSFNKNHQIVRTKNLIALIVNKREVSQVTYQRLNTLQINTKSLVFKTLETIINLKQSILVKNTKNISLIWMSLNTQNPIFIISNQKLQIYYPILIHLANGLKINIKNLKLSCHQNNVM